MTITENDSAASIRAEAQLAARSLLAATLQSIDTAIEDASYGQRSLSSLVNALSEYPRVHAGILLRNIEGQARNEWLLSNAQLLESSPELADAFGAEPLELLLENLNCIKGQQCGRTCIAAWKVCRVGGGGAGGAGGAGTGGGRSRSRAAGGGGAGGTGGGGGTLPMTKVSTGVYSTTHHGAGVTVSRFGSSWIASATTPAGLNRAIAVGKTRTAVAGTVAAMSQQTMSAYIPPAAQPPRAAAPPVAPAVPAPAPAAAAVPAAAAPAQTSRPNTTRTSWDANKAVPGESLHGIELKPVTDKTFYERVPDAIRETAPMPGVQIARVGVIIEEPDGRVWMCKPTNAYGSREHSLPSGTVEKGLTLQQNAIKEAYEETGLQIEITEHAGDFYDSNFPSSGPGSRPYRVYRARRIGGAPWDVAPINNKPGNPPETAQMELMSGADARDLGSTKSSVTGQNKLRSDDTSALAVVTPIKMTTPMKAVDKVLEAFKSRAEEWRQRKAAAGESPGSPLLHVIQQSRGFNKTPALHTPAEMDQHIKNGDIEMLRGVSAVGGKTSDQLLEQYISGDHFPGFGMFGDGTYADASKGHTNAAASGRYGRDPLLRIALKKEARVIKMSDLLATFGGQMNWAGDITKKGGGDTKSPSVFRNAGGLAGQSGHSANLRYLGLHAALAGYDAIHHDLPGKYGHNYYVILNRGMTRVQRQKVPIGYQVP